MAFYAVDVLDGVIRRVTDEYSGVDNKRFFLIEAGSAKQAWAKANPGGEAIGSANCGNCRHRRCRVCEGRWRHDPASAAIFRSRLIKPEQDNSKRRTAMADKGKKDKDKARKQKIKKQQQSAKRELEKQPIKLP
jgi:hypothetical protein